MPVKVKRGLGLLVVAAIALLVLLVVQHGGAPDGSVAAGFYVAVIWAAGLVFLGGLVVGLVLLAWGLLRD